ncbi:MAG: hypothetical protein ACK5B4_07785 [Bacteroidota bacterium]|jgi:hypothetical protein
MTKYCCLFTSLLCCLMACKNPTEKQKPITVGDTAHYYPVNTYIQDQINENDLRNLPRTIRITRNQVKTEQSLTRDSFLLLSKSFQNAIDWFTANKYQYNETLMHDLSTQSYTLSYRPISRSNEELDYLDILLSEKSQQVKRIDIRRTYTQSNQLTNEHLSWRTNKGFLITRETQVNDSSPIDRVVLDVSWTPENHPRP